MSAAAGAARESELSTDHVTDRTTTTPMMRRLLTVAAVLVFLAGVQLFVFPLRTERYFAWTVASPMTAVFLGASYWSAVGLEVVAARSATWGPARVAVPAVFVFTTLTLVVTVAHLDQFHLGSEFAPGTRLVTWAWLAVYGLVPVLMGVAWTIQQRAAPAAPAVTGESAGSARSADRSLPSLMRIVLMALAVVLFGLGAALLVAPQWAGAVWPWELTRLTGRAVGAWLVGLGTAAGHAVLLDDRSSLRPLAVTGAAFGVLQTLALVRHGDELDWSGPPAMLYVGGLAILSAISVWALLPQRGGSTAGTGQEPSRRQVR